MLYADGSAAGVTLGRPLVSATATNTFNRYANNTIWYPTRPCYWW